MQMGLGLACNLCGECVDVCSGKALSITDDKLHYNGSVCTYCESCMDVCPECAIRITDEVKE
jgi:ferredoxin